MDENYQYLSKFERLKSKADDIYAGLEFKAK
jgi:hypothetical protein